MMLQLWERKKADPNIFLREFVDELKELISNGIIKNKKKFKVVFKGFTLDIPAKKYVLSTKGHAGYDCCLVCDIHGQLSNKTVYFPGEGKNLRSDEDFINNKYLGTLQLGPTIHNEIPNFKPISHTPLDYMHLICLGVVKKLIREWTTGLRFIRLRTTDRSRPCAILSKLHRNLDRNLPKEFSNQKPKKLKYLLST